MSLWARAAPGLQEPAVASKSPDYYAASRKWLHIGLYTPREEAHEGELEFQAIHSHVWDSSGEPVQAPPEARELMTLPLFLQDHGPCQEAPAEARKAEQELPNLRPAHLQNCTLRGAGAGEGLQKTVMNWQALCFSTLPPSSGTHRSRSRSRRRRDRDDKKGRRSNDDEALRFFAHIVL